MTPILNAVQQTLEALADRAGGITDEAKREITEYLAELAPDIDVATKLALTGEPTHIRTVELIFDAALTRATDVGAGFIFEQKNAVSTAIVATIRGFIAAGLNVLAPGAGTALEALTRQV